MQYVFVRTYVPQNGKALFNGDYVPENYTAELIQSLMDSGLIKLVESYTSFSKKVSRKNKSDSAEQDIETLDPEQTPRSK